MTEVLDFNHREKPPSFCDAVNARIDAALLAENATRPQRDYLGGSRLGDICSRRLQYEYSTPASPCRGSSRMMRRRQ